MKQIYSFEIYSPPLLNESKIREELTRRQTHRQIITWLIVGALHCFYLLIAAAFIYPLNGAHALAIIAYVCVAVCGGSVFMIIFTNKGWGKNV
ncbi:MAG: hypothetical protein FWH42_02505 [Dehalococcoidia bacterium]|nr:hypothetical protein [Dehalococcoidia bacterium]